MSTVFSLPRSPAATDPWSRFDALDDVAIRAAIAADPAAPPPLDEGWFARALIHDPADSALVLLRLDRAVLAWFRRQGPGLDARINAALRAVVEQEKARRVGG